MICYKDMTFCDSDCKNTGCHCNLSEKVQLEANIWWGEDGAPIATSDFSKGCKDYKKEV